MTQLKYSLAGIIKFYLYVRPRTPSWFTTVVVRRSRTWQPFINCFCISSSRQKAADVLFVNILHHLANSCWQRVQSFFNILALIRTPAVSIIFLAFFITLSSSCHHSDALVLYTVDCRSNIKSGNLDKWIRCDL